MAANIEPLLDHLEQGDDESAAQWADGVEDIDGAIDDQFGGTPLQWACHWGRLTPARLFLERGANPNFRNAFCAGPLHWASKEGHINLVRLLLTHRADRTLRNGDNETPLDLAKDPGIRALLSAEGEPPKKRKTTPTSSRKKKQKQVAADGAGGAGGNNKEEIVEEEKVRPPPTATKPTAVSAHPLLANDDDDDDDDMFGFGATPPQTPPANLPPRIEAPVTGPTGGNRKPPVVSSSGASPSIPSGLDRDADSANGSLSLGSVLEGPPSVLPLGTIGSSSAMDTCSVGYTMSEVGFPAGEDIQALQRAKIKAEVELQHSQQLVVELRSLAKSLQTEHMHMTAKLKTQDGLKKKVEMLQRERLDLQLESKRKGMEEDDRNRIRLDAERVAREKLTKEHQGLVASARKDKAVADVDRRRTEQLCKEKEALLAAKAAEIEEMRQQMMKMQAEKVRLQVESSATGEYREQNTELQKEIALLSVELQTVKQNTEDLQEGQLQAENLMKDAKRKSEEAIVQAATLRRQMEDLEEEAKKLRAVSRQHTQLKIEHTRLQGQVQSLVDQLTNAKAAVAQKGDRATKDMEVALEVLQQEKADLKAELTVMESRAKQLEETMAELEVEKEALTNRVTESEALQVQLDMLRKENEDLTADVAKAKGSQQEAQHKMEQLAREKISTDTEVRELQDRQDSVAKLEKERQELEIRWQQQKVAMQELEGTLARLQTENSVLQHQTRALADVRAQHERFVEEHHQAVTAHEVRCEELVAAKKEAEQRLVEETESREATAERARKREKEILGLEADLAQAREQLESAQDAAREVGQRSAEKDATRIMDLEENVTRLESLKRDAEIDVKHHKQMHDDMRSKLTQLSSQHQTLQAKYTVLQRESEATGRVGKAHERDLAERDRTVQELNTQLTQAGHDKDRLLRTFQEEMEKLRLQHLQQQQQVQQQMHQQLEAQRLQVEDHFRSEYEALKQRIVLMDQERQSLELQVRNLREQNALALTSIPRGAIAPPLDAASSAGRRRLDPMQTPRSTSGPADMADVRGSRVGSPLRWTGSSGRRSPEDPAALGGMPFLPAPPRDGRLPKATRASVGKFPPDPPLLSVDC